MMKMSLSVLGLLGIMVFGSSIEASNRVLDDDIIGEDSVFIKGSFCKCLDDLDVDIERDLDIDIGMKYSRVREAFAKMGTVSAIFYEKEVLDDELEQLSALAPYIYELYLDSCGLDDRSLVVLKKFTELRSLNLLFSHFKTTPPVEFFQHFQHLRLVVLDSVWDSEKEAIEKLKLALPHIAFNPDYVIKLASK